ncbi:MAG: SDR family oxidoreductase [Burkholderiaceae bacterium]
MAIAGTALIIGASRGIGLELCKQYLAQGWRVFGTHRSEQDRIVLRDMGAQTLRLDVHDTNDVAGLAWQLDGENIDLIVMNAGVYGPRDSNLLSPPAPEDFAAVMNTNVLGTLRLLPVVAPLLFKSAGTLAFVSSRMGSITDSTASYGALYRISKAAVNMVARMAHGEFGPQGVRVLSLHPGWVRTDMGGPNANVSPADSVAGLRTVIADKERFAAGGFYDYKGERLAW